MPRKSSQSIVTNEPISITPNDFDIKRLSFKAIEQSPNARQHMAYPKYLYNNNLEPIRRNIETNGASPLLITGSIKINKGGIPRYNELYHDEKNRDNNERAYFYIPFDANNEDCVELFNVCRQIDEYMINEINEKKNASEILSRINKKGKRIKCKDLTYQSLVTTSKGSQGDDDDDDDDDNINVNKKKHEPYERIKVRLSTLYDPDIAAANRKIDTQVYVKDNETPEDTSKITDIEKFLTWKCTAQFALQFSKVWMQPSGSKQCGLILKCRQMCILDQPEYKESNNITHTFNHRLFATSKSSKKQQKNDVANDSGDSKSDDSKSDDDDSENDDDTDNSDNSDNDDTDNETDDDSEKESDSDNEPPVTVKSKSSKSKKPVKKSRN
jgi:hypothetical protein